MVRWSLAERPKVRAWFVVDSLLRCAAFGVEHGTDCVHTVRVGSFPYSKADARMPYIAASTVIDYPVSRYRYGNAPEHLMAWFFLRGNSSRGVANETIVICIALHGCA